jgi:protein-tyrosine-phosphatase
MPKKKKITVLFVCTANICRSPMAAALFSAHLKEVRADWQDWEVVSAGTWAPKGKSASDFSQNVMRSRGLDIRGHRSRVVNTQMLEDADLILTMETGHKEALGLEFPFAASRIFLFNEMVGQCDSVTDPYGGTLDQYEATAAWMETVLEKGMDRILSLAAGSESSAKNG